MAHLRKIALKFFNGLGRRLYSCHGLSVEKTGLQRFQLTSDAVHRAAVVDSPSRPLYDRRTYAYAVGTAKMTDELSIAGLASH